MDDFTELDTPLSNLTFKHVDNLRGFAIYEINQNDNLDTPLSNLKQVKLPQLDLEKAGNRRPKTSIGS